jgi:hypothetical protein
VRLVASHLAEVAEIDLVVLLDLGTLFDDSGVHQSRTLVQERDDALPFSNVAYCRSTESGLANGAHLLVHVGSTVPGDAVDRTRGNGGDVLPPKTRTRLRPL